MSNASVHTLRSNNSKRCFEDDCPTGAMAVPQVAQSGSLARSTGAHAATSLAKDGEQYWQLQSVRKRLSPLSQLLYSVKVPS